MKRCPVCGGQEFGVTAHVTQDWVVDKYGSFVSCRDECVETIHVPDDDDVWDCMGCGFSTAGKHFNVKEDSPKVDNTKKYVVVCCAVHDAEVLSCDLFLDKVSASEFLKKDAMETYETSLEDDPDATIQGHYEEEAFVTSCDGELVWIWQILPVTDPEAAK